MSGKAINKAVLLSKEAWKLLYVYDKNGANKQFFEILEELRKAQKEFDSELINMMVPKCKESEGEG